MQAIHLCMARHALDFDWALVKSFLAVLDAGSLTAAARHSGAQQPTLSRHVAELESQLGAPLFERTGRGVVPERARALRLIGIGLAACEKAVQIEYERKRPEAIRYAPWLTRVTAQLHDALALLEPEIAKAKPWVLGQAISQADITIAVAWRFQQMVLKDVVNPGRYPHLEDFCARAEALPEFIATQWQD